ncbi:DUF2975 domain-containing protein [Cohnella caldifontis]|uniref:DUF2975 domain-containing protein n=1 Tax=Cohnella caldifontis TaxID=3027471 RepID=UPI0023ECE595|nr:DUF2975 domain-containing protein [Cohnella sp. YIM B05605]
MKRETLFLKAAVCLMGVPVLALCVWGLPSFAIDAKGHFPALWLYPALTGMYGSAIPFFIALYQAFRLLNLIDKNDAFSDLSVRALKVIKYCAFAICILYAAIAPLLYLMAEKDDAPGLMAIGLIVIFGSLVIAVFAAVLQNLLNNAIEIKSENDLTV